MGNLERRHLNIKMIAKSELISMEKPHRVQGESPKTNRTEGASPLLR